MKTINLCIRSFPSFRFFLPAGIRLTQNGKPSLLKVGPNFNKARFDRIPNDGHPSVLGHKQIAEKVIHKVKDKL